MNKRRKTGGFELKGNMKFREERFDIEKIRNIEKEVNKIKTNSLIIYQAAESIQVYVRYHLKKTNHKSSQTAEKFEQDPNLKKVFEIMLDISSFLEKKYQKLK